jgi:hypothetical protein
MVSWSAIFLFYLGIWAQMPGGVFAYKNPTLGIGKYFGGPWSGQS